MMMQSDDDIMRFMTSHYYDGDVMTQWSKSQTPPSIRDRQDLLASGVNSVES